MRTPSKTVIGICGLVLIMALPIGSVGYYIWSYSMCDSAMDRLTPGIDGQSVDRVLWFTRATPGSGNSVPSQYARPDRPANLRWVEYAVPLTGDTVLVGYDEHDRLYVAIPVFE